MMINSQQRALEDEQTLPEDDQGARHGLRRAMRALQTLFPAGEVRHRPDWRKSMLLHVLKGRSELALMMVQDRALHKG